MAQKPKAPHKKQSAMLLAHVTPGEAKAVRALVDRRDTSISGLIRVLLKSELEIAS